MDLDLDTQLCTRVCKSSCYNNGPIHVSLCNLNIAIFFKQNVTVPMCSSLAVKPTQVTHSLCLNSKLLLLYQLAEVFPDCSMSS